MEKVLILDFGSQYTELIAKQVRGLNVYSEVHGFDCDIKKIKEDLEAGVLRGIILSGGPNSIYDAEAPFCDLEIFELGIPVLGTCYGMQLMAGKLPGGEVIHGKEHEYGPADLEIINHESLFQGVSGDSNNQINVWMSHADKIASLPDGFEVLAKTANTEFAAMANFEKNFYGVQFHPEVTHTEYGKEIIKNFINNICKCSNDWNMHDYIEQSIKDIREQVGNKKVLLGLSGGVDSSTLAFLLKKAIGDQLICMFIDHGFMRRGEPEELIEAFGKDFDINFKYIDAKDRFFSNIEGVSDPEKKRKAIGNDFVKVFEEEALKLDAASNGSGEKIEFLAQGTLYSDVIESSGFRIDPKTGKRIAATIKSHHNVGGLPEKMNLKLLEPLRTLFKDEVRKMAKELELPEDIINRHPFPGPGLAIRVLGEVTKEKLETVAHADHIMREELKKANMQGDVWQILAALLPVKSVGVMGDKRSYAHPIVIRAVTSEDAMTADFAKLPYPLLAKISNRIVNEVPNINRAVYDITSKPPGTIEWE